MQVGLDKSLCRTHKPPPIQIELGLAPCRLWVHASAGVWDSIDSVRAADILYHPPASILPNAAHLRLSGMIRYDLYMYMLFIECAIIYAVCLYPCPVGPLCTEESKRVSVVKLNFR